MKKVTLIVLIFTLIFSCRPGNREMETLLSSMPFSVTGIDFTNRLKEDEGFNIIKYLYFNNGAGVAAGDINNDGLIDLYFTASQQSNKLYLNRGNLRFEDITEVSRAAGKGDWKTGVTMADVNGDGLLDIYVCQVGNYKGLRGKNQLFINNGDLTFNDRAHEYGLDFQGFSTQAAFFDYDMDGDLDMYLLNHSVHTSRSYGSAELRYQQDARAGDRLFRHNSTDTGSVFEDVTREAGIYSSHIGYGLGVNISDINNDGYPDIYVSNDFHEDDYLYLNNGDGTFSERLREMIAHTSRSSMGNDIGDINNDGLLDILVLDMLPDEQQTLKASGGEDDYELFGIKRSFGYYYQYVRNTLQLNLGGDLFSEIGRLAGIHATDWSWSPLICDVDNDGLKDIFITNGIYRRANDLDYIEYLTGGNRSYISADLKDVPDRLLYEKMPLYPHVNYLYRNNGDLTFSNMAEPWGFDRRSYSNGSTYADLDNDGDLDLAVNNINEPAYIFRNNASQQLENHYLTVVLEGEGLNTRAVGTRIRLYCMGQELVAEQFNTRGFMSAVPQALHFGLGPATEIDSLLIRWPDRTVQVLYNIAADQTITLKMHQTRNPFRKESPAPEDQKKLFARVSIEGLTFRHREDDYVDLTREGLIPHNLSAEGPALAAGDVNMDGLEDLFIGGAAGQAASLFLQRAHGTFTPLFVPLFIKDRSREDVDAAFFDADGDGDPDLYIVRGGNMVEEGETWLSDRLLINDGKGSFTPSPEGSLPDMAFNGSCVRPVDYDGDGDTDLFVGSRSIPGAYGMSPRQFLLENNGKGVFRDVTEARSEGLEHLGMVTDAGWLDYDGDGDPDLVLAGEWMNITLFRQEAGEFTDVTGAAGLDFTAGWWNCLEVMDMDGDGDTDILGGNLGQNAMLKASVEEPVDLYVSDFDNNGKLDPVICAYDEGKSYPVASLDQLVGQIPALKKDYPSYSDFGGKTIQEIFPPDKLDQSTRKSAVLFESCLFLNNGSGSFAKSELPRFAQFSPVRDLACKDFNMDGRPDIVLVGNNHSVRPSYGRHDASYGWCLLGRAERVYEPLMPRESGLKVEGDARKVLTMEIGGKQFLVTAVNNGELQMFGF